MGPKLKTTTAVLACLNLAVPYPVMAQSAETQAIQDAVEACREPNSDACLEATERAREVQAEGDAAAAEALEADAPAPAAPEGADAPDAAATETAPEAPDATATETAPEAPDATATETAPDAPEGAAIPDAAEAQAEPPLDASGTEADPAAGQAPADPAPPEASAEAGGEDVEVQPDALVQPDEEINVESTPATPDETADAPAPGAAETNEATPQADETATDGGSMESSSATETGEASETAEPDAPESTEPAVTESTEPMPVESPEAPASEATEGSDTAAPAEAGAGATSDAPESPSPDTSAAPATEPPAASADETAVPSGDQAPGTGSADATATGDGTGQEPIVSEPAGTTAPAQSEAETPSPSAPQAESANPEAGDAEAQALSGEAPAAAAATAENAEPSDVVSETVTEDDARSSSEDFATAIEREAAGEAQAQAEDGGDDDDGGLSRLEQALLLGAGALAVGSLIRGNREVVASSEDRVVVSGQDGEYELIKDDNALLQRPGTEVQTETFNDGSTRTVVLREDGSQIVTIRDASLRVLRRERVTPDGQRVLLIDDTRDVAAVEVSRLQPAEAQASVTGTDDEEALRQALSAQGGFDRAYSLSQIRNIAEVRNQVPAIVLDNITFETASAAISPQQAEALTSLGRVIRERIASDPSEIFLVEGHTDAVGDGAYNLALSDRRAESVALALTEYFDVPPENLVVQGYGERFLKIETETAERANRRATVRRITPLLQIAAAQ